jgi:hypothetical protein
MERPCSRGVSLFLRNDLRDFVAQNRKPRFDNVPDEFVIHIGITMDEDVSERDDLLNFHRSLSESAPTPTICDNRVYSEKGCPQ